MARLSEACRGRRAWVAPTFAAASLGLLASCVSVPPEAPALSAELGVRLAELERSHIAMLRALMDERRRRVDDFLERRWIPEFTREAMGEAPVRSALAIAADESASAQDRARALTLVATRLQAAIAGERARMMRPMDELERELERRLRDEHAVAADMNTAVTGLLLSASKAADARDRTLRRFGVEPAGVRDAVARADAVVDELVALRDDAADTREAIEARREEFIARIDALVRALRGETDAD